MNTNPENLFCQILQQSFVTTQSEIQAALALPLVVLRGVKSNISRFETIVLANVLNSVDAIEEKILEVLLLNKLSLLSTENNWCQIAYACQALKTELNENSLIPNDVKNYINSPYNDFEKYVCKLGFKKIITGFIDDILLKFEEQLNALSLLLINQLNINNLIDKYLQSVNDSGVLELLQKIQNFANCSFAICTWDSTAQNYLDDVSEKNYLEYLEGTWQVNLSPLYVSSQTKRAQLQIRIQRLLSICTTKEVEETIPRDQVMLT